MKETADKKFARKPWRAFMTLAGAYLLSYAIVITTGGLIGVYIAPTSPLLALSLCLVIGFSGPRVIVPLFTKEKL